MSTKNSLIPVNHSNIKLIDDNFNSLNKREINSGYIEKFTGKEDSQLNNQNTKKENIEHFSNSINACPVPIYKQWTNLEIPSLELDSSFIFFISDIFTDYFFREIKQ